MTCASRWPDRLRNGRPVSDTRIVKPRTFRALETVILSGLRSAEASGARWPEIDLDGGFWTVPAKRMKARKTHVVALSPPLRLPSSTVCHVTANWCLGKLGINDVRNALRAVEQVAGKSPAAATLPPQEAEPTGPQREGGKREGEGRTWCDRDSGEVADVHGMRSSFGTWAGDRGYDTVMIDVAQGTSSSATLDGGICVATWRICARQ